ncbi:MAG: DUF1127 domain-containing protein [Pseudomonadota bacterium]
MRHADHAMMADVRSGLGLTRIRSDRPAPTFGWLGPIAGIAQAWLERHRQRNALNLLDDKMLKDVGLTRLDVEREIRKPFWQG